MKKSFGPKTYLFVAYVKPILRVDFSKIQTFVRFLPYNLFDVSYDPNFFFERKDMIINNLSDILNITIRHVEKFLRVFFQKVLGQKSEENIPFVAYVKPILRMDFSKIQTFVRFLPYNLLDMSYDSNLLSSVKIWS